MGDVSKTIAVSNTEVPPSSIHISGSAKVHLGDNIVHNHDDSEVLISATKALYFKDSDLKREQLALADVGPESFVWVDETAFPTWLKSGTLPFWIRGKPGSGKSTLMKHLADSAKTRSLVATDGKPWTVVNFFFDCRAGQDTANTALGMLKLFLQQLCRSIPEVQRILKAEDVQTALKSNDTEKHLDVLVQMLNSSQCKHSLCAFVDGLDEYEGDYWYLGRLLARLKDRTDMKLCLASRPEAAFESLFAQYPSISMQNHNKASMQVYMNQRVSKLMDEQPFVQSLFPQHLRNSIIEKAQGVMLWARLVVDEMIASCHDKSTIEDMIALFQSLPADLEQLYERILGKTKTKYQEQIAILLYLIVTNKDTTYLVLLYQAWTYLLKKILQQDQPSSADHQVCKDRIRAFVGNLVDVLPSPAPGPTWRDNQWWDRHWSHMQNHDRSFMVRLLHRSLSTYLDRSNWISRRLPAVVLTDYPDAVWRRLTFDVLRDVDADNTLKLQDLRQMFWHNTTLKGSTAPSLAILQESWFKHSAWRSSQDLVLYSARNCFELEEALYNKQGQLDLRLNFPTLSTSAALLHFHRCRQCLDYSRGSWDAKRVLRIFESDVLGWLLNVLHGNFSWAAAQLPSVLPGLPQLSVQALFDVALVLEPWRNGGRSDSHNELLRTFAARGIHVEGRHFCSISYGPDYDSMYTLRARAIIDSTIWRPQNAPWQGQHDHDCKGHGQRTDVLSHYQPSSGSGLAHIDAVTRLQLLVLLGAGTDLMRAHLRQATPKRRLEYLDRGGASQNTGKGNEIRENCTNLDAAQHALDYYVQHGMSWWDYGSYSPSKSIRERFKYDFYIRPPYELEAKLRGTGAEQAFDTAKLYTLLQCASEKNRKPDYWARQIQRWMNARFPPRHYDHTTWRAARLSIKRKPLNEDLRSTTL